MTDDLYEFKPFVEKRARLHRLHLCSNRFRSPNLRPVRTFRRGLEAAGLEKDPDQHHGRMLLPCDRQQSLVI